MSRAKDPGWHGRIAVACTGGYMTALFRLIWAGGFIVATGLGLLKLGARLLGSG